MNILQKIIKDKLKEFKEPKREGTPKGEAIGFQRDKFTAALWCLTSLSKREIADRAECNYNSLLSWQSREDFKAVVAKNAEDVATIIVNKIQDTNVLEFTTMAKDSPGSPDPYFLKLMMQKDDKALTKEYGKLSYYAPFMVNSILNIVIRKLRIFDDLDTSDKKTFEEFRHLIFGLKVLYTIRIPPILCRL